MGNLGPSGWEAPIWKNGTVVGFDAWWTERPFPLDIGAFAHNSTLVGVGKPICPPDYWTSDTMGLVFLFTHPRTAARAQVAECLLLRWCRGETEFLELFCDSWADLEPLCEPDEECHFVSNVSSSSHIDKCGSSPRPTQAWHNWFTIPEE
jgi:hypothetical protein